MKSTMKVIWRFIVLPGLTLIALCGAGSAQQPAPEAAPTPTSDISKKTGAASNDQMAARELNELVRVLLERIERLERKVNELESSSGSRASNSETGVASTGSPQPATTAIPPNIVMETPGQILSQPAAPSSQINAAARLDLAKTMTGDAAQHAAQAPQAAQQPQPAPPARTIQPAAPPYVAWDKDGVKIIPFGILVTNVNYNSSALLPGSWSTFALPRLLPDQDQFNVSPGNTYLGVELKWPKLGDWEINGKVDFNLRGAAPLTANNIFQPQFIHIYGEARTEKYRILAGQTEDVVAPLIPNTLNQYPITFIPGSIGYFRPQIRFDTYQPIGDNFSFIFQAALTQAIQTLNVGTLRLTAVDFEADVFGRQTGLPDGQARVALGYGRPNPKDPLHKRPFEIGVSGHLGKRRGDLLTIPIIERDFTTWSGSIDLTFKIGRVRFDGEFFGGSLLGDYAGAIFQTFNPQRGVGIRATGGWAQLSYDITNKWQVNGGYGRDDPYNRDLDFRQRSLNEMGFVNVFYRITPRLWVAAEFSRWRTNWVSLPSGRAFRVEPAVMFIF